jgi:hypothetical protein
MQDQQPDPANHSISETRVTDYEKMIIALQPIAEAARAAYIEKNAATDQAITARVESTETGNTYRARVNALALTAMALIVCALAWAALQSGNVAIAEKIIFGLFAFAGGFAARR